MKRCWEAAAAVLYGRWGVDPRRKKLSSYARRAVCAVVMAAVVGAVGVQSAAAETEAEAISKANRTEIDWCLERYEEDIEEAEASGGSIFLRAYNVTFPKIMKYKEWTKADSDKYSALKQRHEKMEQAQAAEEAASPREKIDALLNLYEEATVAFEAGDKEAGLNKMLHLSKMGDASVLMHYKEWTQADSDRMAALTERAQNAAWSDEQKAYVKKAMEEPHASQELLNAIWRDDAAAIQKLIAEGEDPNATQIGTPTPVLWAAADANKPNAARALIEAGADVMFKFKNTNTTILHGAARRGGRELLTVLLDAGAKKYVNEVSGTAAAMNAASTLNLEGLKVLMAYGANLNKKDSSGMSILWHVYDYDNQDAASSLEDFDIKAATKKWEQARKNEADFLSFLIKSGVNKKADLSAALFKYVENPAAMKILIDAGADVNRVTDESGRTPLFEAIGSAYGAEEGYKEAVSSRANSMPYMTAIYGAEKFSKGGVLHTTPKIIESIRLLIAAGANVNTRDENGNTLLHEAAQSFRGFTDLPEIIHILLDAGVNVDARNNDGKTPLMWAASCNAAENAKALIAAGADVNAKDKGGYTPLWYATTRGNYGRGKVEAVLRAHGGVGADTSFKGE